MNNGLLLIGSFSLFETPPKSEDSGDNFGF